MDYKVLRRVRAVVKYTTEGQFDFQTIYGKSSSILSICVGYVQESVEKNF